MHIAEARTLIEPLPLTDRPQRWMDLGCGGGTFTLALAEVLPTGSSINAWDMNAFALQHIPKEHHGVTIKTRQADFLRTPLPHGVDGILVANALHYAKDQKALLSTIHEALVADGILLIAEYDTDVAVPTWVPFPISFQRATALFPANGFTLPRRIGSRPSAYGRGDLYTAFARRLASSSPR